MARLGLQALRYGLMWIWALSDKALSEIEKRLAR